MLFASSRDTLFKSDTVSESTLYHDVQITHQTPTAIQDLSLDEFLSSVEGENILLLVHGYNNDFNDVVRAYDVISEKINSHVSDFYHSVIGYTWPGGDDAWDYFQAKRRSGVVAPRFASLLQNLVSRCDSVDVMSHSLGARIVMRALTDSTIQVRSNFLLASAIDNESLGSREQYSPALQRADGTIVFHSKQDAVLRFAYTSSEWDYALGYLGPEDSSDLLANAPTCYVANCKNVVHGHGQYKYADAVFQFVNEWLNGNIADTFITL